MVDNRSSGFFGVGGSFNFKSGDISGTAAKTSDEKMAKAENTLRKEKILKKMKTLDKNHLLTAQQSLEPH